MATKMWHIVKFSNIRKQTVDDFIALFHRRYNRLKLINISPEIKEYVFAESHFSIIYNDLIKQVEFHGPSKTLDYCAILFEQTIRKLFFERSTLIVGRYTEDLSFGPPSSSMNDVINISFIK